MTLLAPIPLSVLSDDEERLLSALAAQTAFRLFNFELLDAYYNGEMRVASLGISIPPQLDRLRTVVGWPRVIVDSIEERLDVEGFRFSDGTDADSDLWDIWQANDLDSESQLGHLDGLVFGSSYITVGSPDDPGDLPKICVESPREITCLWDARTRTVKAAYRQYGYERARFATMYLPDQTIYLEESGGTGWIVTERDIHNLGTVPVVRMSNRARTNDRFGRSEITPEVISITDAACRTALGMEVSREFFAAPQRYVMGASESSFQAPDGTTKSAWETYLGRMLALERDESGNLPTVGQFAAGSPAAFTEVLDQYAKIITSITGLPSEYLGITTSNPSSADAIRMNSDRLVNKVRRKQRAFEGAWESAMRLALLIRDGSVPDDAQSMETLWRNPEIPTPAATTDAIAKQIQVGAIPPTSDVTLEMLGYSALQRARLAADRDKDAGAAFLAELATSLQAKEARVDTGLANDIRPASATPGVTPGTPPAAPPAKPSGT